MALIVLAVGLAVAVRAWNLNSRALNFDEVYEVTHCTGSLSEIVRQDDGMPPTYHLLLEVWISWFGSDIASRWLSAAFGIATVIVTGFLGRQIGGDRVGGLAALLLAFSSMHVYHSQEARCYAMLTFSVALVLLFGWRLLTANHWRDWALFGIAGWLAVATHYYAAVPVVMMGLYIILARPREFWPRGVVATAVFALSLAPIAYCFRIDLAHDSADFSITEFRLEEWAYTYVALVGGYTLGPPMNELRELTLREGALAMLPYALAIAACGLPLTIAALRAPDHRADAWRLLGLVVGSVLLLGFLTRFAGTGYIYRYVSWLVVPLCLFLALGLDAIASVWWKLLLGTGLVAMSLVSIAHWNLDQRYAQDDFHGVAELLANEGPSEAVLSLPLYFAQAATYHLGNTHTVVAATSYSSGEQNWDEILPKLARAAQHQEQYWVVAQWLPQDDPRLPVREGLLERLEAEEVAKISTVLVYRADVARLREVAGNVATP